ncbi:MAG: threonine--tRNA ligase [Chloroflexi bacterium]|nr:threonine--tRNA ligase [Chloroflexota bacterium]
MAPEVSRTEDREDGLVAMRHSASHVMAEAVSSLFPNAKFGIGPPIEDGFYYDFDLPRTLAPDDLAIIESRMAEIVSADLPFVYEEVDKETARRIFASQPYKLELIEEIADNKVGIYRQGSFIDLCRGPHVASTGQIKAFKLLNVAGAYWRGDEHRPMLQRIYGAAFDTEDALKDYLRRRTEAEARDHRRLGRELDLFSIHDEVGAGLVLWHPKGGRIRNIIENFWREEHYKAGYEMVYSSHIGKSLLWETSGHLDFYKEYMYSPLDIEGQKYYLKPMNCPFHILMYQSSLRSYRELPLRWAELGTVYRYERSGVLHGLMRVRGFTQDDAHIFCRPDQIEEEIAQVLDFSFRFLKPFGFQNYEVFLATQPEKYVGQTEDWQRATTALRQVMDQRNLAYHLDEGGGAFYGPKIDVKIKDALDRLWQCTTIQFDFNLPNKFDLSYIGDDGKEHRPYMVHRALFGSIERFLGVLIEYHGGAFPLWLAPVQVVVIPIADRHIDYARRVAEDLRADKVRVEVDERSARMNLKIREAQLQKIPYMLVVGDKEIATAQVSVRSRSGQDLGTQPLEVLKANLKATIQAQT